VENNCPACGEPARWGDRYCHTCGQQLHDEAGSFDLDLGSPAERAIAARANRRVGVVFGIVGSLIVGLLVLNLVITTDEPDGDGAGSLAGPDEPDGDGAGSLAGPDEPDGDGAGSLAGPDEPDGDGAGSLAGPDGPVADGGTANGGGPEPSAPVVAFADVAGRLDAGPGHTLAWRDRAGIHLTDLADGSTELIPVSATPPEVEPLPTMAAVGDAFVYIDDRTAFARTADAMVELGSADALLAWPFDDRGAVWLVELDLEPVQPTAVISARRPDGELLVPSTPVREDYVLAGGTAAGVVAVHDVVRGAHVGDTAFLLPWSQGRLVGVGARSLVTWECSPQAICGPWLVRSQTSREEIDADIEPLSRSFLSPDDRWLFQVVDPESRFRGDTAFLQVVDFASGDVVTLDPPAFGSERASWSSDSRLVAWASSNRLWIHEPLSGNLLEIDADLRASNVLPGEVVLLG